ncbi:transcriptional regulator, MarR family [Candidatus Koribacter versatilis Ellin345]|uniref:Transcriptional regulator, MarR family n=1 Tax=Koribacter versatilis (strain Ellin345) TaxID=204669 RepID=Q1IIJ9_KORVE|nr:MarR family transcriptional regulator [Candidatus Koribacter versatilis]ABF43301.1 transcriptional regulator, MarR family [Candidatus Koribacter versatilis Ellin345]
MKQAEKDEILRVADRLHSASIHLLRRLRVRDRESGIGPAQLSALSVLVFGGPKSLAQLAEIEQVKPPTMSRIVAGLERSKLVKSQVEKDDARRIRIVPTAKGEQVMWDGRKRRVETLAELIENLSANDVQKLGEIAEKMDAISRKL